MNRALQFVLRTIYYLAWWCIVTGLSVLVLAVPFMVSQNTRIDDDFILLVGIPVGLLMFVPVARRSLRFRRLHGFLLGIGGIGVITVVTLGVVLLRRSKALTGVTGPFAGTGELITAAFCILLGLFFVAVAVAGATGISLGRGPKASGLLE